MSQSLDDKLAGIEQWMRETERTISSQDSYNSEALLPSEIDMIYDSFMEVFNFELHKRQLAVMIKSVKLFLKTTSNLLVKKEKLAPLLESMLINLLSVNIEDRWRKPLFQEVTLILEDCFSDGNSIIPAMKGLTKRIVSLTTNANLEHWMKLNLLKSFNKNLSKSPLDVRNKMFRESPGEFEALVDCLYTCGDYDMQVTIVETILRFTNKNIRSEVVSNWFPNYVKVQSLFLTIKDFENDCRNFLNHFNEGLGEKMSVCSFKLLSCRVEGRVLVKPLGLNDFWTDFNLGTCSISLYYVFQEDQDSDWQILTLTRSQIKKIWTKYGQGTWKVLISCSESLNPDIEMEFGQPKSIPEKLKMMFGTSLIESDEGRSKSAEKRKASMPVGVLLVEPNNKPRTKSSRKSLPEVSKPPADTSQEVSDLPCAQLSRSESVTEKVIKTGAKAKPQQVLNKMKKAARRSVTKPMKFLKRSLSSSKSKKDIIAQDNSIPEVTETEGSTKAVNPGFKGTNSGDVKVSKVVNVKSTESKGEELNKHENLEGDFRKKSKLSSKSKKTKKVPNFDESKKTDLNVDAIKQKLPDLEITENYVLDEDKTNNLESVSSTRKSKLVANSKLKEIEVLESKKSDEDLERSRTKENEIIKSPKDITIEETEKVEDNFGTMAASDEELKARNRLSYSGRRIRAQRKALKRKSDDPNANIFKKKICFDQIKDVSRADDLLPEMEEIPLGQGDVNVENPNNEVSLKAPDVVANLLSDWDDNMDDDKIVDQNEPIVTDNVVNLEIGIKPMEVDLNSVRKEKEKTKKEPTIISKPMLQSKLKDSSVLPSMTSKTKSPHQVEDTPLSPDNIVGQECSSKDNFGQDPASNLETIPSTKSKRRSSTKVLFSTTMMDSEADEVLVDKSKGEVNVPTYDEIHKKKRSTVSFADVTVASPKKKTNQKSLNSSVVGGTTKRIYNRRNSSFSKANPKKSLKGKDPYDLSISPKVSSKFSSFKMKKKSYGSKRRSTKLFSDDSDVEEPKVCTPLEDYTINVNNGGGDSIKKNRAHNSTLLSTTIGDHGTSSRRTKKPQNVKEAQKFLEHVSGVIDMYGRSQEGVTRKVLMDLAFYITEKNDILAMQ